MRVVPAGEHLPLVGQYVAEKCDCEFAPGMYQGLAILNDQDEFVGGVVIDNYQGFDCRISCATETSAAWREQVMRGVFHYIFVQLGCVRVTAITAKGNKRAREFMEGLGFQLEGNLRLGYKGVKDALIYGLLARECRYLAPLQSEPDEQPAGGTDEQPELQDAVVSP